MEMALVPRSGNTLAVPDPADRSTRDQPWLMRTYSGHSTASASNELYRANLSRGQTGLSIAFDLPTQTGYDPDDPLARGEDVLTRVHGNATIPKAFALSPT